MLFKGKKSNRRMNSELIDVLLNNNSRNKAREAALLIKKGADVNTIVYKDISVLWLSASQGYATIVESLLASGADVNQPSEGKPPVFIAAEKGHKKIVELIMNKGRKVNYRSDTGMHAFHSAAAMGHAEIVNLFVAKGIDPNLAFQGKTALYLAVNNRRLPVVRMLLTQGGKPELFTGDGDCPLLCAARNGFSLIAQILIQHGVNVNIQDPKGRTPLHEAVHNRHPEIVSLLLKNNADPSCRDREGKTALDYAKELGNDESIQLICAYTGEYIEKEPDTTTNADLIAAIAEQEREEKKRNAQKEKKRRDVKQEPIKNQTQPVDPEPVPAKTALPSEDLKFSDMELVSEQNQTTVNREEQVENEEEPVQAGAIEEKTVIMDAIAALQETFDDLAFLPGKKEKKPSAPLDKTDEIKEPGHVEKAELTGSDTGGKARRGKREQKDEIVLSHPDTNDEIPPVSESAIEKNAGKEDEVVIYDVIRGKKKEGRKIYKPSQEERTGKETDEDDVFYCEVTTEKEKKIEDRPKAPAKVITEGDDGIFYLE